MSMRLAMYVSMYIYTYEKVSLYRASEHKIYVYASSHVCVYVYKYIWKGEFVNQVTVRSSANASLRMLKFVTRFD